MDVGLEWLGIGVGLVGSVVSFLIATLGLSTGGDSQVPSRRTVYVAAVLTALLTLALWLVSSMKDGFFSMGQSMGIGFAIGGVLGIVAQILSVRLDHAIYESADTRRSFISALCPGFLGLLGVSLVKCIFHGYPQEALMGLALAVMMAGILHYYTGAARGNRPSITTETWAVFTVTLTVAVVLAVLHFDKAQLRIWWSLPLLIASTLLVAGYVAAEICSATSLRTRPGAMYVLCALISSVITIGMAAIYSWKLIQTWQLLGVVAGGAVAAAIVAWIVAGAAKRFDRSSGLEAAAVVILVVLAAYVGVFKLWGGMGAAIGAIAAWSVALPSLGVIAGRLEACTTTDAQTTGDNEDAQRLAVLLPAAMVGSIALLVTLALFRLFLEKYRPDVGSADIRVHYTYVGAMLGAVAPFLLVSAIGRIRSFASGSGLGGDICALLGVAFAGLVAAGLPLVLCLVWGTRAALGLVYGLPVALALWLIFRLTSDRDDPDDPVTSYPVSLLVLGSGVAAAQLITVFASRDFSRSTSVTVLAVSVGLVILWVALSAVASRKQAQ